MALGDSNFNHTLERDAHGGLTVGGPFTWAGIPGPGNRELLSIHQVLEMKDKEGNPLPGTPLADVVIRYVLVQGTKGKTPGQRTHAGVATIKPGATEWTTTISKSDLEASGLTKGEARGVGMAVSLNHTASTPAFETLTWCVRTTIG